MFKLAAAWIIIVGGLIILFGPGGIIDIECIKCGRVWTWLVGVISVAVGVGALAAANRGMPGR
ncbi:hypothetical protein M2650_09555 [Luteimonas sp. SX5]|uniref:Uncharacterized protein n=1 Tax=Luteimonas galliterrae TaxID=2940486 RepID=A0ABT0MJ25_9GAMM|nr:hypothetical protein [Luteimonas galliterrae]MCL1634874.1 hypothetical protein [Luteimonas galliterrae]